MRDERTESLQTGRVILLVKVDRAADFRVHVRAAQLLGFDDLADGGFDQRRPGEIEAAAFGHEHLVAKHREIGAAGDAVAHDRGELRDARGGDNGVVAKDPAEVVLVGKNFVLHREENAGGIDQINDRQCALKGDALRTDELLGGLGKKGAGFHGRVVGDDHARNAGHLADARDSAGGRNAAPLLIHFVGGPQAEFEKVRAAIEQVLDPLTRRETPHLALPVLADLAPAFAQNFLFAKDCFAPLAKGAAGSGVGA